MTKLYTPSEVSKQRIINKLEQLNQIGLDRLDGYMSGLLAGNDNSVNAMPFKRKILEIVK